MLICCSFSALFTGVKTPFTFDSEEFKKFIVGKPVYLNRYKTVGHIIGVVPEKDLVYAEAPDCELENNILDSMGLNICSFEVIDKFNAIGNPNPLSPDDIRKAIKIKESEE